MSPPPRGEVSPHSNTYTPPHLAPVPWQCGAWPVSAGTVAPRTRLRSTSPTKSTLPPRTTSPPPPDWHPPPLATPAWVGERDRSGWQGLAGCVPRQPLTPCCPRSVGAGAALRRGGRAVGGGPARLGQRLPQHVGGLRAVAAGRAAGRQGQHRLASGPRKPLAGAQGPRAGGEGPGKAVAWLNPPPSGWVGCGGSAASTCWVRTSGLQGGHVPPSACALQVSGEKKQVGSTVGMQSSVDTSPLLKVQGGAGGPSSLGEGREGRAGLWRGSPGWSDSHPPAAAAPGGGGGARTRGPDDAAHP